MVLSLPAKALILLACVVLTVATAAVAQAEGPEPSTSPVLSEVEGSGQAPAASSGQGLPYDEREAQVIDRMLMCPVCPAVTIDQTQVALAQQMQRVVREMLVQGASRQQILDFFVERYGPGVLAAPPKAGVNLLAWILPAVAVVAALGALFLVLRSMVGHPGQRVATEPPSPEEELTPYLEVIDRELADPPQAGNGRPQSRGGRSGNG
jgi:cytochrome c-type biogenesis protein CcmH